ncbi:MAG: 3-dehydroquinate synthase, partial [Pseudomonadota bacterium]
GEAVGAGMRMAARMSDIDAASRDRLDALIDAAGLPKPPDDIAADDLLAAMGHDKKVQAGKIRLVLLRRLGDAFLTDDYDPDRLYAVLAGRG